MQTDNAPFKVGDEVVCIDLSDKTGMPGKKAGSVLQKDEIYVVSGIYKVCCNWAITVGIAAPISKNRCSCCKNIYLVGREWHFAAFRFRKAQPSYSNAISEILEKFKPYEGIEVDVPVKIFEEMA